MGNIEVTSAHTDDETLEQEEEEIASRPNPEQDINSFAAFGRLLDNHLRAENRRQHEFVGIYESTECNALCK